MTISKALPTVSLCPHLRPEVWQKVNRLLVRKALAEFSHERLLTPQPMGAGEYSVLSDDGKNCYRFKALVLELEHWQIDAESIVKGQEGLSLPLDALAFMLEFKTALKLKDSVLPVYLDEISSTLYGSAFKHDRNAPTASALADADFQTLEGAMTEGHPCFVANNGRIGFGADDYLNYAPEVASPFALVWLAVHKNRAALSISRELDYKCLIQEELGETRLGEFKARLADMGLDDGDYWFMPAHPWQWQNKLTMAFAAEIATRQIVFLGTSDDEYLAQQSIRTMFNISSPRKRYVKTALSILNMGFMRGLSPYYMEATPAINDWVAELVHGDPELQARGFTILKEVAAIGYRQPYYETAIKENNGFKKMFSVLWRECPLDKLAGDERLMTMTALVHLDNEGNSLLAALIERSGVSAREWIEGYLEAFFTPILHCFYRHNMIFMPHGENLIMVLDGHRPVRVLMKDIAEEVGILNPEVELPKIMQRVSTYIPDHMKTLSLFVDVFDGFFRHLAAVLHSDCGMTSQDFWQAVARCSHRYQQQHPELSSQFARYDLFADDFEHSCLNRLQMANNQHMLNLEDPASGLQMAGKLANPLARWKRP